MGRYTCRKTQLCKPLIRGKIRSEDQKNFSVTVDEGTSKTTGNIEAGKKVYLAGPMFNQAEKDFNLQITKVL